MKEWQALYDLPKSLNQRMGSLSETALTDILIENHSVFHKSWVTQYNKDKLKRKTEPSVDILSVPEKTTRQTRSSLDASNFNKTYFFCGQEGDLHTCETKTLDKHVRHMAELLCESKLLARLSAGGMCAAES